MNLLFVAHHQRWKTELRSAAWARELARRGHQVTLLCTHPTRRLRASETVWEGVRVVEQPDLLIGSMRSGWDPWSTLRRAIFLRGRRYDLVHAFETRPATIHPVRTLLRRAPAPLVMDWNDWWGRGGLISERRPRWYQILFGALETWYEEHFRTLADHTTVISSALARRAESLGVDPKTITVIPGGVNPAAFAQVPPLAERHRFGLPADRFVLMFAAADAAMDLDLVIGAVALAARRVPNLLLVLTGRRPPQFEALVRGADIGDRVVHLGFLPYGELPRALSCADVFLLPLRDTVANRGRWPHKIGEYMACGRATVANPVGDLGELLDTERVGLAADPTPEAMAEAIVRLHGAPELRETMGRTARRVAETRFAWPVIVDRVEQAYEQAIAAWRAKRTGIEESPASAAVG